MAQSLGKIFLHVVFSTKGRAPFLLAKPLRLELHAYLGGTCAEIGSPSLAVGGVEDHIHILCQLARTCTVADTVRELKRKSSKWIKQKRSGYQDFHWQDGYGAFSVSPSHLDYLRTYIATQEEHHAGESFQDEFRGYLKKYDIEYDERYVWD